MDSQLTTAVQWKDLLLGPPLATSRLVRERLGKVVALAVFSSDAISSTAYGTEQIMLVLVTAGAVATGLALPVALGIGALLAILVLSYRQTITAYPSSGYSPARLEGVGDHSETWRGGPPVHPSASTH